jgi:vacuolar-type H+-ATPase subunit C/Vma6
MHGGINYAALNAKTTAKADAKNISTIISWLPFGVVRDFVRDYMDVPCRSRGVGDYLRLWARVKGLDGANRRAMSPLLGAEIDMRNLIWLYRLKCLHGAEGDAVFNQLIPVRRRLGEETLRRMAAAKNEDVLLAVIKGSPYSRVFTNFNQPERAAETALLRLYKSEAMARGDSIAGICRFLLQAHTGIKT